MKTLVRLTVAAVATTALLAGCTGDGDDKKADDKKAAKAERDKTSPQDLPKVPEIKDFEGALKDVKVGSCSTDKGDNTVEGTVKNSTDKTKDYVITISWVTPRSDVVARGVETVENLKAGDSKKWSVKGTLAEKGSYSCTTQVQRGKL